MNRRNKMETKEREFFLAGGQSFPVEREAMEWLRNMYKGVPDSALKELISREVVKITINVIDKGERKYEF